jgi:flap endonuclease-1
MGIPYLNAYIKRAAKSGTVKKIDLQELYGKTIVVDTSIYLYRFIAEGSLLENMYIMLSLFRYNNITPIFVFDGKAPREKKKLLEKRNHDKIIAQQKHNIIKQQLDETEIWDSSCEELYNNLVLLKKKFVRLKREDIIKVQNLMKAFGVTYIEADGEADGLCAKLVQKKYAYACLSEDMDLFIYGCPLVLRYLSLTNRSVILYSLSKILTDLNLTFKEFKEICILSGTDYNYNANNKNTLYRTLNYFKQFKKSKNVVKDFYTWVDETSDYIPNIYELYNVYNMFQCNDITLNNYKLNNLIKPMNKIKIEELMKPEGFIFIKS